MPYPRKTPLSSLEFELYRDKQTGEVEALFSPSIEGLFGLLKGQSMRVSVSFDKTPRDFPPGSTLQAQSTGGCLRVKIVKSKNGKID